MTSSDLPLDRLDHRRARPLLGTLVEVSSPADDDGADWAVFSQACDAAFAAVAHVHDCMSLHMPDSDLSKLARAKVGQVVALRACTAEVLRLAAWFEQISSGVFNAAACAPTLAARRLLPASASRQSSHEGSLLSDLEWMGEAEQGASGQGGDIFIRVLRPVWIDLGGIAKGWAVDAAVRALMNAGLRSGVVNAGGDLRVFGEKAQPVDVPHPGRPGQFIALVSLADGAMATTAFQRGEKESGSAWPDAVVLTTPDQSSIDGACWPSVSVLAPSCAMADALTKVLMIMGPQAAAVLRQCGAQGVGIDLEGRIHHV